MVREVLEKKEEVATVEGQRKKLVQERSALVAFDEREEPLARLVVTRKAMPETIIEGPNTTMRLRNPVSRSLIAEVKREDEQEGSVPFFEMVVSPLPSSGSQGMFSRA
jgi:C4-type Zn-finger protein